MVTINDIAKASGVSHGTVSNVLNNRGNVSVEKIRLVEETAQRLGYRINAKAQVLRQGISKAIAVILPNITSAQYAQLYEVLQKEFLGLGYSVSLYLTHSMEAEEGDAVRDALAARVSVIIASPCSEDARLLYSREALNTPVYFINRPDISYTLAASASFDFFSAGQEIGTYLIAREARTIGLFTLPANIYAAQQLKLGLETVFYGLELPIKTVACADNHTAIAAFDLFDPDCMYDSIVCMDAVRKDAVLAAHSYASQYPCPPIVTIGTRKAVSSCNEVMYEMDYQQMAHQIVGAVVDQLENGRHPLKEIKLQSAGFQKEVRPFPHEQQLNFLTVASPASVALKRLLPHFKKETGIDIRMTVLSLDDLYDVCSTREACSQYDLIRTDMAWMGEMAAKIYQPLGEIRYPWEEIKKKLMPVFLQDYISVLGEEYCLPYDPSTQILFYRKDLLEHPICQRMFYEQYKRRLTVPQTFDEYNQVARFFTRRFNPHSPVSFGSTVAVGNAVVSPSEYMPRLFGCGGHILNSDEHIDLDTPEALMALKNYMEAYEYSDKTIHSWWKSALEGFASGSAAMTVVFMNHASDIINSKMSSIAGKIGFSTVPGGKPLIGGGVIGITKTCRSTEAACRFYEWLYSDQVASALTMLGGLSPCRSVYQHWDILEQYPWLSAAAKSFPIGQRRISSKQYTNFSEKRLEKLLSIEIKNAVIGILPPEEALHRAQANCEAAFIRV